MNMAQYTNLDIRCAELGRMLAQIQDDKNKPIEEKAINESLAVLEEQGPYAMFLYLRARHNNIAGKAGQHVYEFLKSVFDDKVDNESDILKAIKSLANSDLDDLLFARDLLRTALAYARYHLKAKSEGS
ncbi:MAG: hypothetical protein D6791_18810 [Chloroflexi bacterium]|nr:MAG: hypothetical protein D6791_18810 [Chloroflexota bacterium]